MDVISLLVALSSFRGRQGKNKSFGTVGFRKIYLDLLVILTTLCRQNSSEEWVWENLWFFHVCCCCCCCYYLRGMALHAEHECLVVVFVYFVVRLYVTIMRGWHVCGTSFLLLFLCLVSCDMCCFLLLIVCSVF